MTHKVLDNGVLRDATPAEAAEIEARIAVGVIPTVPSEVTRRKGLQRLRMGGHTEASIEAMIATLPLTDLQKDLAVIEFRTSQVFERNRPLTVTMGAMIGLDAAGLDQWFIEADALV